MTIFYDIETLPTNDPNVIAHLHAGMKAPGNMSKPETIEKWLSDPKNLDKEVAKTSLDGAFGRVCVLGYAIDEGPIHTISLANTSEESIVESFRGLYIESLPQQVETRRHLVGFNSRAFDLPFLHKRALIHGIGPIIKRDSKPWDQNHTDVMVEWSGGSRDMVKQSTVAMAMGIPANEDDITGADVAQVWRDGGAEIVEYHARKDVEQLRNIYYKMYPRGASWA